MGIDDVSTRKTSTYKAGMNAKWQQHQQQDRQQSLDAKGILADGGADKGAGGEALAQDAITRMIMEFDTVFDEEGQLKPMKGEPMEIHMKKDVPIKLLHICNTRKTPYAFQAAANAKLDDNEEKGIIEKVTEPSQWCTAMSFVPKPGG
jgi:hypothetical protein